MRDIPDAVTVVGRDKQAYCCLWINCTHSDGAVWRSEVVVVSMVIVRCKRLLLLSILMLYWQTSLPHRLSHCCIVVYMSCLDSR
jgi:hypothetical protein